jgi:bifunctional UDP-N-acetylglucosamine pyrophosphorylase/glucosamine-1-phosphate N-acetyltransferase
MNKIVILAAGKGTRMNSELPKVLVPVDGRPMIEHLLNSIVMSGVDEKPIVVVSPENQDLIKQSLHSYKIDYVVQEEQLGTGHAVACALRAISLNCKKVLVFNGDHPFVKIGTIVKLVGVESEITMLTATVEDYEGWQKLFRHWGRIVSDSGQIQRIVEFKDATDEERLIKEVNPAMYAFDYVWLKENIKKLQANNAQKEIYLTDLVGLAFEQDLAITGVPVEPKEVIGINSREELEIAEGLLK